MRDQLARHPSETWGYAPDSLYHDRWTLLEDHLPNDPFVVVDWGSDAGWFSVRIAGSHPHSSVVSVEAGIMTGGRGLAEHRSRLEEFGIVNNIVVESLFGPSTFERLWTVPSDYQLVLSVFHHMGDGFGKYLKTPAEWDNAFCDLIRGSNVTFFEVPNENSPTETPHRVRSWYHGRDVETVITEALARHQVRASVELLGETRHGSKGTRKMFKISLDEPVATVSAEEIADHIRMAAASSQIRNYRRFRIMVSQLREMLRRV